ncbi:c-type cytochrome [Hydrogenimonas thermophila]|uniref:c-type cytochrome n=1 Tax=Hydrogenimonas thermophila TaxID=223786 RepID=UPI0029372913|nr:c-type cytochrome [Hydrogenimonas thermophila]WOE69726.1 c-type cytochrome [Hydrogenimonas thermophila]WOE72240.1 c-type cytochrome [Hydrogenimonas thermophila]
MKKLNYVIGVLLVLLLSGCTENRGKISINDTTKSIKISQAEVSALYARCAGCHGLDGKKRVFGKSGRIASQSKSELIRKITGYQKGTFGGSLKGLMARQVEPLTPEQVNALAEYISKL